MNLKRLLDAVRVHDLACVRVHDELGNVGSGYDENGIDIPSLLALRTDEICRRAGSVDAGDRAGAGDRVDGVQQELQ